MSQAIKIHGLGSSGEGVGRLIRNEELGIRNEDGNQFLIPNSKFLIVFV